ncbi:uracil-DNA glycosylase [Schlesneria paludicola]|uniref:uracil-DNA glycosylase n=1 Tax=Schlesneria paludicola TaxID=360056 RepID=UPI00029B1646|nr:uracil-DNA glycosylase [Schlesneria paludicola]
MSRSQIIAWDTLNRQIVGCTRCPRLRKYCQEVAQEKRAAFREWEYWGLPVPNFGDPFARLMIVGLAPAAHGGNRTGRLFTGDVSGDWLYRALFKAGFSNQPTSVSRDDGLELYDCAITNPCHCAPPVNKPNADEIANCSEWYDRTVELLPTRVIVALGQTAWQKVIRHAAKLKWLSGKRPKFRHGLEAQLDGNRLRLLGCFHPSPRNTYTRRLTEPMLDAVFTRAKELLDATPLREQPSTNA